MRQRKTGALWAIFLACALSAMHVSGCIWGEALEEAVCAEDDKGLYGADPSPEEEELLLFEHDPGEETELFPLESMEEEEQAGELLFADGEDLEPEGTDFEGEGELSPGPSGEALFFGEDIEAEAGTALFSAAPFTQDGSLIRGGDCGVSIKNPGDLGYPGNFCAVRLRADSQISPFGEGAVFFENDYGQICFSEEERSKGSAGFLISDAAYSIKNHCRLDLRLTVLDWSGETLDENGKAHSAPLAIGIRREPFGIVKSAAAGDILLKAEFLRSGTEYPISENIRILAGGLSEAMRLGVRALDGRLDPCALSTSTLMGKKDQSHFGREGFLDVYAQKVPDLGKGSSLLLDFESVSAFELWLGRSGNEVQGILGETELLQSLSELSDGVLGQSECLRFSGEPFTRTNGPAEARLFTRDAKGNEQTDLVYTEGSTGFSYLLDLMLPKENAETAYEQFSLSDELPAGVLLSGPVRVLSLEDGSDISSSFDAGMEQGRLIIEAKDSALSSLAGGISLRFLIPVSLDLSVLADGSTALNRVSILSGLSYKGEREDAGILSSPSSVYIRLARPAPARLTLKKEISAGEIIWEHGEPVFILLLEGEDLYGKAKRYVLPLAFERDKTGTEGTAAVSAELSIAPGSYILRELEVLRYRRKEIRGEGLTLFGEENNRFALGAGQSASITLVNERIYDEGESDTALVRNLVID